MQSQMVNCSLCRDSFSLDRLTINSKIEITMLNLEPDTHTIILDEHVPKFQKMNYKWHIYISIEFNYPLQ